MKQSTIITILAFALGVTLLAFGFVLFTDNNISKNLFGTTTTTTVPADPENPGATDRQEYLPMDLMNTDLSKYVTIGAYKDVLVDYEIEESAYKSAEDYIKEEKNLTSLLIGKEFYDKVTEGTIAEGTIFSFDYCGKLNGVAFKGGTAQNTFAYITGTTLNIIGGSTFIDGFAEQMLGAAVGSEFDINIKFPDNYGVAELNGKDTVFTVKINHIVDEIEFNDEFINRVSDGEFTTAQKFIDDSVQYLLEYSYFDVIQAHIITSATIISVPEEEFNFYYYDLRYTAEDYAASFGMTYENFLASGYGSYFLGISAKSDDELRQYVQDIVKTEIVLVAIAKAEGYTVTDAEYQSYINNIKEYYGITEKEIFEYYSPEKLREEILISKVTELLKEKNGFNIQIVPDKTTDTNTNS